MLQSGIQTFSFIASASVHPLSCVLFGTFHQLWVKICWTGGLGRGCNSLKAFQARSPDRPPDRSTFYCREIFICLFSFCSFVKQKKNKKKNMSEPHQHTRGVNSHTPNTEIAELKNESRHHNRASQSDDALGFNQHSPTHQQSGLARYLWQLSLLPGVVTMVSAGCDYPLVGLTPLHGRSIMFVSLCILFSRCVVKNHLHFRRNCISVTTRIFA